MLKKFYIEDYLYNKIKQEEFVLSEAVQGDITKHTLLQLFSMDNIKYLNQFLPQDHKAAERKRMDILYDAMKDRDNFLKKDFEENFEKQKEKLKELFEEKKEKIYFTKDFEETIINHCARSQAWEKTLVEGQKTWWDSTVTDGGRKYQSTDFEVSIKFGHAIRIYKVNLYLREMAQRIEGKSGNDMGSDLSFPREDPHSWNHQSKKFESVKRFNGMIIPSPDTLSNNYDEWLSASSSGLLSSKSLKHGEKIDVEGEKREEIPGLDSKHQVNFMKHSSLKNKNMFDIERVLIRKEIRACFQKDELAADIIASYGKPKKESKESKEPRRNTIAFPSLYPKEPDEYKDLLNQFIERLLNLGNYIHTGPSKSKRLLTFLDTITYDSENPEQFFKEIVTFTPKEKVLLVSLKQFSEEEKKIKDLSLYEAIKTAVDEHGVIELFDKEPYKKSFINIIIQKQFIKWIKDGNYKVKNPITGNDELAEIKDDQVIIPDLHVPTFKKTISYYDPNHKKAKKEGGTGGKETKLEHEIVDMPILLPGSILIEKARGEEELSSFDGVPRINIGEEIWNPHEERYEQRYYDKKREYEEKAAANLLTPNDLIGIQGTEDKTIGGQRPNHNIESFKTLCPDPEGKDNRFWNKINRLVSVHGSLALCHFTPAANKDEHATVEFKEFSPSVSGYKSIVETANDFIVVKGIAEAIARKLRMSESMDSHVIEPERLNAMQHFKELYHAIFAKIFSNLGNINVDSVTEVNGIIGEKVNNYLSKDIANRGGRASRNGTASSSVGEEDSEPTEVVSKSVATQNMQSYMFALDRNFLTLCKTGQSACGKCTDPLDTRCSIVMDEYLLREKLTQAIKIAIEVDQHKHINVKHEPEPTTTPEPPAPPAPVPAPAPAPVPAPALTAPAADRKLTQTGLFGDLPSKPKRTKKIIDPDPHKIDFALKAKMKIIELLEPIINIKFANINLHNQQQEENRRAEISNIFKDKMQKKLANISLSHGESNNIEREIEKERDNQISLLSEEYKTITDQLEANKREIVINLTNYFRHVNENQSIKLSLLDALQIHGIHIEDHIPADTLKEYGLQ